MLLGNHRSKRTLENQGGPYLEESHPPHDQDPSHL